MVSKSLSKMISMAKHSLEQNCQHIKKTQYPNKVYLHNYLQCKKKYSVEVVHHALFIDTQTVHLPTYLLVKLGIFF